MAASSYQLPPGRVDRSRESCDNDATSAELPKKKMRKSKLMRAKVHNSEKKLDCYVESPFASNMDLLDIMQF